MNQKTVIYYRAGVGQNARVRWIVDYIEDVVPFYVAGE
jgi:hypothetical protein